MASFKCPSCGVPPLTQHKSDCPVEVAMTKLDNLPDAGMSSMTEAMVGAHEIYLSHVQAGFTAKQSLWLVAAMMNPNFGMPPDDDPTAE